MRWISGLMVWLSVLAIISILAIILGLSATRLYHLTLQTDQADQVDIKHHTRHDKLRLRPVTTGSLETAK